VLYQGPPGQPGLLCSWLGVRQAAAPGLYWPGTGNQPQHKGETISARGHCQQHHSWCNGMQHMPELTAALSDAHRPQQNCPLLCYQVTSAYALIVLMLCGFSLEAPCPVSV